MGRVQLGWVCVRGEEGRGGEGLCCGPVLVEHVLLAHD